MESKKTVVFEVSKEMFHIVLVRFNGLIFHRKEDERYFFKIAFKSQFERIEQYIKPFIVSLSYED